MIWFFQVTQYQAHLFIYISSKTAKMNHFNFQCLLDQSLPVDKALLLSMYQHLMLLHGFLQLAWPGLHMDSDEFQTAGGRGSWTSLAVPHVLSAHTVPLTPLAIMLLNANAEVMLLCGTIN